MGDNDKLRDLNARKGKVLDGGGPKSIEKQHAAGKLTAREAFCRSGVASCMVVGFTVRKGSGTRA